MDATGNITPQTIEAMTERAEFGGFGYLGHSDRASRTDVALAEVVTDLGWTLDEVFEWVNSRPARHFMDVAPTLHSGAFRDALRAELPKQIGWIRAEIARA